MVERVVFSWPFAAVLNEPQSPVDVLIWREKEKRASTLRRLHTLKNEKIKVGQKMKPGDLGWD